MTFTGQVTWQPLLGVNGVLIGAVLDPEFAKACAAVPAPNNLQDRARRYVWSITKPADWGREHTPSNILDFHNGSLLVQMVQRYSDHGKWLDIVDTTWHGEGTTEVVVYNYHHGGSPGDNAANQWLQFAFDKWVQFAHIVLQEREGSS